MSIYTDNGYESRKDYLQSLADDLGVPFAALREVAALLGPDEDFDGLVTFCEDNADQLRECA